MITISTGGIGPMDITTGTKAKGASKDEEKAVDAFASLMNMVSSRQEQPDITKSSENMDVSEVVSTKDTSREYVDYKKQDAVDSSKDQLKDTDSTPVKEDTQVADTKKTESNTNQNDKMVDDAANLIKDVKVAIMDALGVTEEELDNLLAEFGTNIMELMIGDNLKNFVLQVQGASNVDLLVNENLANMVNELTLKVEQLVNEYGFAQNADFEQFIVDNFETIENAIQTNVDNADIVFEDVNAVSDDAIADVSDDIEAKNYQLENKLDSSKVESEAGSNELSDMLMVESESDSQQSMAKEQSSGQNNQQIVANFNHAIDNTVNANSNVDVSTFTNNIQEADIIRQIIDQIKVNTGREIQSMEVQLNPENLGKVYVNVEAKDGVMQAKIIAETEAAKNAIENNLAVLKENFSNQELKVEAIEVMVAAYGFFEESQNGDFDNQEQANDSSKSIGGINVNNLDEDELTEEEELEVEIMKTKGNTVSYTV